VRCASSTAHGRSACGSMRSIDPHGVGVFAVTQEQHAANHSRSGSVRNLVPIQVRLALQSLPGVGLNTTKGVLRQIEQSHDWKGSFCAALHAAGVGAAATEVRAAFDRAERIVDRCGELDIAMVTEVDDVLPDAFWRNARVPLVLFARRALSVRMQVLGVAVVGTRNPTESGVRSSRELAEHLALASIPVVSGLALGCDTAAHWGALGTSGQTVAVLGHGLDLVYPAANRVLADEILARGGILLSEHPPGVGVRSSHFVARNRLQVALSRMLVVVESAIAGGTMHTVRFARAAGVPVACLSPSTDGVHSEALAGNLALLSQTSTIRIRVPADVQAIVLGREAAFHGPRVPEQQSLFDG
jgi:DNA processing protein